jgi:glycosyltransferase involved in cell wall biosynthesis
MTSRSTSATLTPYTALSSLDQRLLQAATALLDPLPDLPPRERPGAVAAALLPPLVERCRGRGRADARWLLLTAAFGAFPTSDELLEFGRWLELQPSHVAQSDLLAGMVSGAGRGRMDLPMTLVTDSAVVDVDHSARTDTHTGIHRVVREVVPRWRDEHDARPVAWIDQYSALRALSPAEEARIYRYGQPAPAEDDEGQSGPDTLVVPWRSTVVLVDVPNTRADEQLAALARFSGNTLALVGYDMIPITSADTRPFTDSVAFGQYLSVVKHAHRIAGISTSATAEFAGFASAVRAQGLPCPEVRTVELVTEPPTTPSTAPVRRPGGRPVVLATGTREPHKNQRGVLHAAERLWLEGLDFEVRLVGGSGWNEDVLGAAVHRLRAAGHPVTELGRVSDAELTAQLRAADLVAFLSLHEGYGLPVAEALACGTPVLTSDFGSQREIARAGGCRTVDPRDDDAVTDALRTLLADPGELDRLRAQIAGRPARTWTQYADELWTYLVRGEGAR